MNRIKKNNKLDSDLRKTYWFNKLYHLMLKNKIVIRTFLIKKKEYIKSLKNPDINNIRLEEDIENYLINSLPSLFWISEISLPELFPTNKRKIADILIDSSKELAGNKILEPLLFLRMPGILVCKIKEDILALPSKSISHIPLIKRSTL